MGIRRTPAIARTKTVRVLTLPRLFARAEGFVRRSVSGTRHSSDETVDSVRGGVAEVTPSAQG
jgi:hypothetical protein